MTHRDEHLSAERIQAFLDGELSQAEMARIQGHSASCVRCQSEIEAWRLLFDELEELPTLDPSPGLVERVMGALPNRPAAGAGHAVRPAAAPSAGHLAPDSIQDFLDGRLARSAQARADAHLADCHSCRAELAGWQAVFSRLEGLDRLAPSHGFAERIMEGLEERAPVGLLARFRRRVEATSEHLSPERLGDLLDGRLSGRSTARTARHLAACDSCQEELAGWQTLFSELETLGELPPSDGFSDRVMAGITVRAPAPGVRTPMAARIRGWVGGMLPRDLTGVASGWARRLVPQSRRAWAFVASVAAAPTLVGAAGAAYLFSHPLLTPGYLASYLWWKASGAVTGILSRVGAVGLEASQGLRGNALVEALAGSAGSLMLTGILFTALMGLSLLIVYRNLFAPSVNARYARISS